MALAAEREPQQISCPKNRDYLVSWKLRWSSRNDLFVFRSFDFLFRTLFPLFPLFLTRYLIWKSFSQRFSKECDIRNQGRYIPCCSTGNKAAEPHLTSGLPISC